MPKSLVYPFMTKESMYVDVPKLENYPQSSRHYCISVDYGTINPCSMGLWCLFGDDWYKIDEYYFDSREEGFQKTDEEYYECLCELAGNRQIIFVIVDPSAASFIEVIKRHRQFVVRPAVNNLKQGLFDVNYLLTTGRIKICKNCENAKREFSLYEFDADFKPIRKDDHTMDDIRYFVSTMFYLTGENKMCEYCHCIGNNHHYQCPNYNGPDEPPEPEKVECCRCPKEMYKEDDEHYVEFSNGDIVCNDCLRDYVINHYC